MNFFFHEEIEKGTFNPIIEREEFELYRVGYPLSHLLSNM